MTRSRAKRQQAKQVTFSLVFGTKKNLLIGIKMTDDACMRMMVMDFHDAASAKQVDGRLPAGQSLLRF